VEGGKTYIITYILYFCIIVTLVYSDIIPIILRTLKVFQQSYLRYCTKYKFD